MHTAAEASCLHAVDPQLLVEDDYSRQMLAGYNSLWIHLNVTIDNQAWYPDLGYVARTNHNRLANKLQSEGFNVVSHCKCCACVSIMVPLISVSLQSVLDSCQSSTLLSQMQCTGSLQSLSLKQVVHYSVNQ